MVALGFGSHVNVWKGVFKAKQKSPYMAHKMPGSVIRSAKFVPYEDILGIGTSRGYSSIAIPGSGEANFDSFAANPFETHKQARERTVQQLLEKLPAELISLDTDLVGKIDAAPMAVQLEESKTEAKAKRLEQQAKKKTKTKARGRNSSTKRWRRKRGNVMDERTQERRQKIAKLHKQRKLEREEVKRRAQGLAKDPLNRFK
jgi:U3 small nucleolar RNA-associated protein 7